jgi:hypothetical protein
MRLFMLMAALLQIVHAKTEVVLLGPRRVERIVGKPAVVSWSFPARTGVARVRVEGGDPHSMVAAGRVLVNGQEPPVDESTAYMPAPSLGIGQHA